MNTCSFLDFRSDFLAAWPSGKAGDCKSFIPSSNLGAAWSIKYLGFLINKILRLIVLIELDKFVPRISWSKRITRPGDTGFWESIVLLGFVLSVVAQSATNRDEVAFTYSFINLNWFLIDSIREFKTTRLRCQKSWYSKGS